jgi:hypothetical protein
MAGTASAQYLGQMSPASVINNGTGKIGGYFIGAEHANAVVGSIRYGLSDYTEGRFRFGFIDEEGKNTDPHVILGLDAKYLLWKYTKSSGPETEGQSAGYNNPFDLSTGAGLEYAKMEGWDVFSIGGSVMGSIPYRFENNSVIEPYARLNLRYQRNASEDYYIAGVKYDGDSSSDFELGLNLGALFSVTPLVDFTVEVQIDDETAFMLGIDFAAF